MTDEKTNINLEKDIQEMNEALKALKAQEEATKKLIEEKKKKAAEAIPVIKAKIEAIDAQIAKLQADKIALADQLKLFGVNIGVGKKAGIKGGGILDKATALITTLGVGGTFTNKDFHDAIGTSSGYAGMVMQKLIESGYVERTKAGEYKILVVPVKTPP